MIILSILGIIVGVFGVKYSKSMASAIIQKKFKLLSFEEKTIETACMVVSVVFIIIGLITSDM